MLLWFPLQECVAIFVTFPWGSDWAVTSGLLAEKDIFYIQGCMGSPLDPTTSIESSKPLVTRMGIDATKPFNEPFSEVCEVDLDILEKIDLEEYIR